ncbi:MAG TPA: hypothetical protein VMG59_01355 [Phycisphaerae bacterium]|nr:hypothetical protein [Phycisphaerae bacterium]
MKMNQYFWTAVLIALPVALLIQISRTANSDPGSLIVHEWGTFTSCQDENGSALGAINTDDEPLPPFVHDIVPMLINPNSSLFLGGKGVPDCDPDVTMRLETPVLYFYPQGNSAPKYVSVSVDFHGGWLTQYFPDALAIAPGLWVNNAGSNINSQIGRITANTVGRLVWQNVELNASPGGPQTDDYVWTSPRQVNASYVQTPAGETERFLFYRGVGHLDSPLRIIQTGSQLQNVDLLRKSMHQGLVAAGLYDDEATALLNTWQLSYFRSGGERVFFIVPQVWTDWVLPLDVHTPADITRVMVGRIELVTPEQRALLNKMATMPADSLDFNQLVEDYNQLGRFAAALIINEEHLHPSPAYELLLKNIAIDNGQTN